MQKALAALAVLVLGFMALLAAIMVAFVGSGGVEEAHGDPIDGVLDPDDLPEGAEEWILKGAEVCPEVTAPYLAATGFVESRWELDAVSPVGARGPFQIMPATWEAFGVDADGDGVKDPHSMADAAVTAGHIACDNARMLKGWDMEPDVTLLAASYNAGAGAVHHHGGVPPFPETQSYVQQIRTAMGQFIQRPLPGDEVDNPGAQAVIEAAQSQHGVPYSWGGGDFYGPTLGSNSKGDVPGGPWDGRNTVGFDCSGLMEFAFYKGTNGKTRMGDTTRDQIKQGKAITISELSPGDIVVFDDPKTGKPFHVALYAGAQQFVHAEQPGTVVATANLFEDPFWSGLEWHPRRIL